MNIHKQSIRFKSKGDLDDPYPEDVKKTMKKSTIQ
jgi:hypothetical protein